MLAMLGGLYNSLNAAGARPWLEVEDLLPGRRHSPIAIGPKKPAGHCRWDATQTTSAVTALFRRLRR
jgi:hypothetical protein